MYNTENGPTGKRKEKKREKKEIKIKIKECLAERMTRRRPALLSGKEPVAKFLLLSKAVTELHPIL